MISGVGDVAGELLFAADDKLKSYLKDEVGLDLSRVDLDMLVSSIKKDDSNCASFETFSSSVSSLIAVHETYFMRHREQFDWIEKQWLPDIIAKKRNNSESGVVRILSAGCATGEEPYSLCAHLKPVFDLAGLMLEIDAVDICESSLNTAKKGRYSLWSLRGVSPEHEQQWLDVKSRSVEVKDWVKEQVRFYRHNITRAFPLAGIKQYDLILCRNVMIYMHTDAINRTFRHLSDLLKPDGYLIPGPSDPNPIGDSDLQWQWEGGVRLLSKKIQLAENRPGQNAMPQQMAAQGVSGHVPVLLQKVENAPSAGKNKALADFTTYDDVERLLRSCHYDQARAALELNIERDVLDVRSYVMLAVLAMDLKELRLAATATRNALFLQPDSPYTNYLMANYKQAVGDREGERLALQWAKKTLLQMDPLQEVEFCEEYTVAALMQVVDTRINC